MAIATTATDDRSLPALPARGLRDLVLFLGLIAAVVTPRASADGDPAGGCNNGKAAHVGALGAVGGGTILAKVCSQGDGIARVGVRLGDDLVEVGVDAARVGNSVNQSLDGAVGASKIDAAYNSSWEEAAEIIGRLASNSDVERYPGAWKEAGVELYLSDAMRWTELGGDELLAMAAVRSPAMRKAVEKTAKQQFERSLGYLANVEHVGPQTIARVKARYGVDVIETAAQSYRLEYRSPDYLYKLIDRDIHEEAISERASFDADKAEAQLRAQIDGIIVREARNDIAGLYGFRRKDLEKREFPAFWVGPEVVLKSTVPEDFDRLVSLIGADNPPEDAEVYAQVFAELWVAFHEPLFSGVCNVDAMPWANQEIQDPAVVPVGEGAKYTFYSRRQMQDCLPHVVLIGPDEAPMAEAVPAPALPQETE